MNRLKKAIIIGAGMGGLATAIRLQSNGYQVFVFEKNPQPGGKLREKTLDGFRFDLGPSLFTRVDLVLELLNKSQHKTTLFEYERLNTLCHYFFPSGKNFQAPADTEAFIQAFFEEIGEPKANTRKFLSYARNINRIAGSVFLENSLHKVSTYLKKETLVSMLQLHKIDAFRSMYEANTSFFETQEAVQFFNRFATYNGSNPYQTPATLNLISTLEMQDGAFFPKNGMHQITQSLFETALNLGVTFSFNTPVNKIVVKDKVAVGIETDKDAFIPSDIVVSNMDAYFTYDILLQDKTKSQKIDQLERSGSALIYYWGMNTTFPSLDLHNIFFSEDYKQEFDCIFKDFRLSNDPTVYINITSKKRPLDAPEGMENWFVMINAPAKPELYTEEVIAQTKKVILTKLEKMLGRPVQQHIITEEVLTPGLIEKRTSSYKGALYGTASNSRFASFLRPPNFDKSYKNLYFCGGSVHPGGGIPLCLLSAKIVEKECV
jgi:phytoene desaturase